VEYELQENKSKLGHIPGFKWWRAVESSSGVKRPEIYICSGVGAFHKSDSCLLKSLVYLTVLFRHVKSTP